MSVLHNKEIQETSLTSLYVTASESNSITCTFECIFGRAEKLLLILAVWVRNSYFVYRPIQISFTKKKFFWNFWQYIVEHCYLNAIDWLFWHQHVWRWFVLKLTCMEVVSFVPTFGAALYCCFFLIACMKYKLSTVFMKHSYKNVCFILSSKKGRL